MRTLWLILAVLLIGTAASYGQVYNYVDDGPFTNSVPDTIPAFSINNGLAVSPDGRLWIQSYGGAIDSFNTGGPYTGSIYVFNPDGSPAPFSPIQILSGLDEQGNSVTDTLDGSGYGMTVNPLNGNIMSVKWSTRLWEIDYTTGQGVRRIMNPIPGYTSSLASVAVNDAGEVVLGPVLPGGAVQILNPDFSQGTQVVASVAGYGRDIETSGDGNDVYVPRFDAKKTYVYHSDFGSLGPYALADSIFVGGSTEVLARHPVTGFIWGDVDTRSDSSYTFNSFYAYDPVKKMIVDSIPQVWPNDLNYPRGMAFSPTGDTVYVGHFGSGYPRVERFVGSWTSAVEPIDNAVPDGFELSQNFPNPFNPSTEIRFTVAKNSQVKLAVYDVLGREITTLVNETMPAGSYSATFNAPGLSSGTYIYVLTAGDVRISKKMLLAK